MKNKVVENVVNVYKQSLEKIKTVKYVGRIKEIKGTYILCSYFKTKIGDICFIDVDNNRPMRAEVIGFDEDDIFVMLLDAFEGLSCGDIIYTYGDSLKILLGNGLLGKTINSYGETIDGNAIDEITDVRGVYHQPPHVLKRKLIRDWIKTGVRSIDGLLSVGMGQRLGIFSQAGLGKSSLLSLICKNSSADVNVIVLIGERGREVKEFVEDVLGDAMKRTVLVVSTGNESPLSRVRAIYTGMTIAEYFRDQEKNVMLISDSITRLAMAQREIGSVLGEAPISKGYTPSVFALLSTILERATNSDKGTITSFYSVLLEDGDGMDVIGETVKGIIDGHIILSKDLFSQGHFPAIDITKSVSRLMSKVVEPEHQEMSIMIKKWISAYDSVKELLDFGAYVRGENHVADEAIDKIELINDFLKQTNEAYEKEDILKHLKIICGLEVGGTEKSDLMSLL